MVSIAWLKGTHFIQDIVSALVGTLDFKTLFQANIPHLIDVLLAVFMGSGEPWVFMHPTSPQAEMDGSKAQTHWNQRASLGLWKFLFWLVDF